MAGPLQPIPPCVPRAVQREDRRSASHALEKVFREHGLPAAIRSEANGSPFASTGIHGLCALNVWWMKLGIIHQRIQPSSPQENGARERMHKTLKARATRPPAASLRGQQWKFDSFQRDYQLRASTRSTRRRATRIALGPVPSPISRPHRTARVPRPLRSPTRQQRRRVQNRITTPLPQPSPQGRPHRSRASRRWPVEHRLLQHAAWPSQASAPARSAGLLFPLGESVNDVPGHL